MTLFNAQAVIIPPEICKEIQRVAGADASPESFQNTFEVALGRLLATYDCLSPEQKEIIHSSTK